MGAHDLSDFPHPRVVEAVGMASEKLVQRLSTTAPLMADPVLEWLEERFGVGRLADSFLDPASYPLVHLPTWAVPSIEEKLVADLSYSSMAGYVFIRLIDDVVDGDRDGDEAGLLPSLAFFHLEFLAPYQRAFEPEHSFWTDLEQAWVQSAEAAIGDQRLQIRNLENFKAITARKTRAAIIPVAAALHFGAEADRLDSWSSLIDAFSCWHQFNNDLFGWRKDLQHGNSTFLLDEGRRSSQGDFQTWFWDEGLDWAQAIVVGLEEDLREKAAAVQSPGLTRYLETRFAALHQQFATLREGIAEANLLARLLEQRV